MWQTRLSGFLGLAVIIVSWLNVSLALEHWLLVIIGLTIAVLNFWAAYNDREENLINESKTEGDRTAPPIVN